MTGDDAKTAAEEGNDRAANGGCPTCDKDELIQSAYEAGDEFTKAGYDYADATERFNNAVAGWFGAMFALKDAGLTDDECREVGHEVLRRAGRTEEEIAEISAKARADVEALIAPAAEDLRRLL